MTEHEALGLTIQVYKPTFAPYVPTASHIGTFRAASYEHESAVGIGYDRMRCTAAMSQEDADWWLDQACGAHVVVRDETNTVVWEGRVNTVGWASGGRSVQIGPLSDVANRCVVTYQLLNTDTNEAGEQKRTDAANNTDSQARYGIQHQILAAGAITTAQADQRRDVYVLANGWPLVGQTLQFGGGEGSLSLDCLGYWYWLNYPYRLANVTGTVTVSAKLAAVLAADPNAFFGGANQITSNALTVQQLEDQDRLASEIIADVVSLGDASYNRYLFGVWTDRVVKYEAAPTTAEYLQRISDPRQVVTDLAGNVVHPWAIRPGKWLLLGDVQPGTLIAQNMAGMLQSRRSMFIERVHYTSAYGLQMNSGVVNSYRQALAQWGVTGM